jgi:transposase-like protein
MRPLAGGAPNQLTTAEHEELRELEKRVKRLEQERDILKCATEPRRRDGMIFSRASHSNAQTCCIS